MSAPPLALCFGVHNHQPFGNFDHVVAEATERAYRPFLELLQSRPDVRVTAHFTGSLLEWLRERSPRTFDHLGSLVARGQVELLTGGFYEPILAILPDADKIGQIERLTHFIKSHFGVRPRGMWLAERVWEPHLPRAIREAGVEFVLVDDRHFALAGLDAETVAGYYLTEEQGSVLGVFPISQRLRYLIPFDEVDATLGYLAQRRGNAPALTIMDDGEKFGVWPGTYAHVYEQGWLARFFDRLIATPWLSLMTFSEVVDRFPATGRVYLPTASYREMGEWALSTAAGRELVDAKRELALLSRGERLQELLRGGFWRTFLVKYPEIADMYWKMVRLSQAIHREAARRPDDIRLAEARTALWRGQANDAYWHGVFGGVYLPHLRRAVKAALLDAERRLGEVLAEPACVWRREDGNGDGRAEIFVRTADLAVTLAPEAGGCITELGHLARALDVADVLARRPETYHEQIRDRLANADTTGARTIHDAPTAKEAGLEAWLEYDQVRRASLLDGFFPADGDIDPVTPWSAARIALGAARYESAVEPEGEGLRVVLRLERESTAPLAVEKLIRIAGARLETRYRLHAHGPVAPGRWGVQLNLALTAGEGAERYLDLPGRPAPRSRGREPGRTSLALVDKWAGLAIELSWSPAAEVAWGPVETVSVSESGFERIYQGTAFLILWPVAVEASNQWETMLTVTLRSR